MAPCDLSFHVRMVHTLKLGELCLGLPCKQCFDFTAVERLRLSTNGSGPKPACVQTTLDPFHENVCADFPPSSECKGLKFCSRTRASARFVLPHRKRSR